MNDGRPKATTLRRCLAPPVGYHRVNWEGWAMRMPRLTIRRMMIAFAVAACILRVSTLLIERRRRFLRIASDHAQAIEPFIRYGGYFYPVGWVAWHEDMREKYAQAAAYPWFPIAADPPEPALFPERAVVSDPFEPE
jgi:hypothetical protein